MDTSKLLLPAPVDEPPKGPDLKELARAHTESALGVLTEIMTDTFAPKQARIMAANAVLDRGHGKPKQEVEQTQIVNYQNLLQSIRVNENRFIEVTDVEALPPPTVPRIKSWEEML